MKETKKGKLLTGNGAAAWGARLASVDYVPAFPITPQTEIIETISRWIDVGEWDARMVTLDSEHSMITAAGAAATTGARVFTATSSQGLLYGMEMMYTVAGWRAPFVMVNVSRGLAAPLTLESDHNDILAARDSGFLQIYCSTSQEVLDSVLMAYRLGEDERVRLPVIVNLDGFYLSFTREPVDIPEADSVKRFLPPFESHGLSFRASAPMSQAVAVLGGPTYSYFRYQVHLAALNGLMVYDEVARAFSKEFGRSYQAVEAYRTEDAEVVFVMLGAFATKAKEAVNQLRKSGKAVGLVRPLLFRPFPAAEMRRLLRGKKGVAVIDQNLSMGGAGVLHTELSSALYGQKQATPVLVSFIGGLGGRDIRLEELYEMESVTRRAAAKGTAPPPRLLYTQEELKEMKVLQAIAAGQEERR
jgi:pyruvate ferredoxin oxidoreductase alpha subunit